MHYIRWVIWLGWILLAPVALAQRVTIFDYDERDPFPDALSKHIELKLNALMPGVTVVHYTGRGNESDSIAILSNLESKGLDLIIVRTSDALVIAQHTLFKTPVLYTNVNNPKILGFRSLGPPGGNISGVSYYIPIKRHLLVYKRLQPALKRPGFIFDKNNKSRKAEVPEARKACMELDFLFDLEFIKKKEELQGAVLRLIDRGADSIIASTSGMIYDNIHDFKKITDHHNIPVYSLYSKGVYNGAVAGMSGDYFQMADALLIPMALKVLAKKAHPGDMPAAFLKANKVVINQKQAQRLQMPIPETMIIKGAEILIESVHPQK